MKRIVVTVIAICLLGGVVIVAQTAPDTNLTNGSPNGRFWSGMSDSHKTAFVYGYASGLRFMSVFPDCTTYTDQFSPFTLTYAEIVKALDQFYGTPENARIALPFAVGYVARKARGAKQSDLDDLVGKLRESVSVQ